MLKNCLILGFLIVLVVTGNQTQACFFPKWKSPYSNYSKHDNKPKSSSWKTLLKRFCVSKRDAAQENDGKIKSARDSSTGTKTPKNSLSYVFEAALHYKN